MQKRKVPDGVFWNTNGSKKGSKKYVNKHNIKYGESVAYPESCTPTTFCLCFIIFIHIILLLLMYAHTD
ncbi:hypothetical protein RB195_012779 [Necator americanus]|uniref:Uncharacterized protein n=1 Tax=Necator americanus TaxID=51031 RepID=A0ABR1DTA0_NECAM